MSLLVRYGAVWLIQGTPVRLSRTSQRLASKVFHRKIGNDVVPYISLAKNRYACRTFIDIGANAGSVTVPAAPGFEKCISIEPAKQNRDRLRKAVSTAGTDNCEIFECALGEHEGTTKIFLSKYNELHSTTSQPGLVEGPSVNVCTLDRIIDLTGLSVRASKLIFQLGIS